MKKLLLFLFGSVLFASPQGVPTMTTVTVTSADGIALTQNLNRGYLLIQNQGVNNCYVSFGAATTASGGYIILPGNQYYEPVEAFVKSSVSMRCPNVTETVQFLEVNY